MNRNLAGALVVALLFGGLLLVLARTHWSRRQAPGAIRQALFLAGMGAGLVTGLCVGLAIWIITDDPTDTDALPGLQIGGFLVVGLAGHFLGLWLERRRVRRCPLAEDYGDDEHGSLTP
ncbi:MAG TPA: hypothetical protein VKE40_19080 [Gemmataceae bacterium]|nr:hypothetical protein [Gemmataceae bacterium]